jgi:protein required for attachment to host cells
MNAYLVVADSTRARLFTWPEAKDPLLDGSPRLIELENVTNPEGRLQDREVFSNRNTTNRPSMLGSGPAHSFDDHREGNRRESELRYIRRLTERLLEHVAAERPARLLLVAEPHVLDELRQELVAKLPRDLDVIELAENLSKHSASDLHVALAHKGLLPSPLTGPTREQFIPRGQPVPGSDVKRKAR